MNSTHLYLWSYLILSLALRIARLVYVIRRSRQQGRGDMSAKPIFWVMTWCFLSFLGLCSYEAFHRVQPFNWPVSFAGLALYLTALLMREQAMKDLGRFFSPDIEIRKEHEVVREGLYRFVRHPLLACMGLEVIGVGLVLNAYHTLIGVGFGFYFPLLWVRKSIEEETLLRSLGQSYQRYCQDVGAFWPKRSHFRKVRYV